MNSLWIPISVPLAAAVIAFFLPRGVKVLAELLSVIAVAWATVSAVLIFLAGPASVGLHWLNIADFSLSFELVATPLRSFILLFVCLFGLLMVVYSLSFMAGHPRRNRFFAFVVASVGASAGAVTANNLLVMLLFWEFVTVMLFFLVNLGEGKANIGAAKSFVILGLSDCALLLGIAMLWSRYGTLQMDQLSVATTDGFGTAAFLLCFAAAIAKAGAMPLHTWLPSIAESAPAPVLALLPGSLDKLLGIYLLTYLSLHVFKLTEGIRLFVMIVGAATIVLAVMAALVQHNLKRLLSFHAVSQVGYMVLGVGTGTPVGIMGGLFHMLNHAIYKSCLFLTAGSVGKSAGTNDLEELGGLSRTMPVTFLACLVASLSISGVPPLNGFASKWLVYQGLIDSGRPILLAAAMFGSALTLASFIKVLYSVFLGQRPAALPNVKEAPLPMAFSMVALALLCVAFGIFAQWPIGRFIAPVVGASVAQVPGGLASRIAFWSPSLATLLIVVGLLLGGLIYLVGRMKVRRTDSVFVGGERLSVEDTRVPGTGFYETIRTAKGLTYLYSEAERGVYDLYVVGSRWGSSLVETARRFHDGRLSTYLSWCLIGVAVLAVVLIW